MSGGGRGAAARAVTRRRGRPSFGGCSGVVTAHVTVMQIGRKRRSSGEQVAWVSPC